jgi:hypothetical protein
MANKEEKGWFVEAQKWTQQSFLLAICSFHFQLSFIFQFGAYIALGF